MQSCQVAVANEILCIARIWISLGPITSHGIGCIVDLRKTIFPQIFAEFIHLFLRVAHIHCTCLVGSKLGSHTLDGREGSYGHDLSIGRRELVSGKDVSEKMCLEIIVVLRTEIIVERTARELGLYLCSHFERSLCIVPDGRTRPCLSFIVCDTVGLAVFEHLAQYTQCIERAWEACVGIEVREGFLEFVDGYTPVKSSTNSRIESGEVALCFEACYRSQMKLTLSKALSICSCCHNQKNE